MSSRRQFALDMCAAITVLGIGEKAISFPEGAQDGIPTQIGVAPDFSGPVPPPQRLGTETPSTAEMKTAQEILDKAPKTSKPVDVAQYFLNVGQGKYGPQWIPYVEGWPAHWNPVIVAFFHSTSFGQPTGDLTPWCAAFVNWCVKNVTGHSATNSASSGSFKKFGTAITQPKRGDIVVFRRTDDPSGRSDHGHVGFYLEEDANAIRVLGGNQITRTHHKVSVASLPKHGNALTLYSYQTHPDL